MSIFNTYSNLM